MKKIFLLLTAFIFCFLSTNSAYAENFYIKNYDINITLFETNKVQVEEKIDVFFTSPSHGIYRSIPLSYNVRYPDGSSRKVKSKISKISATEKIPEVSLSNGFHIIKMGNANKLITGDKTYEIKYIYTLPNPNYKDGQEFYYNIVGTQWNTKIEHVSFNIQMPKEFDKDKVGLSIGSDGLVGFDNSGVFSIKGLNISGMTSRTLNNKEGITIRVSLPKDYFKIEKNKNISETAFSINIGMFILALVSFLIWLFFGKDEPVIPIVNFYPPLNQNSAEVGVEYRGKSSEKDVISLIFYLASKGYIEIEDNDISFKLKKLKDYKGKNPYELKLMNILFAFGRETVTQEELIALDFYKRTEEIQKMLQDNIKKGIFDKNACTFEKILIISGCILGLLALLIYTMGGFSWEFISDIKEKGILFLLVFPVIALTVLISGLISKTPVANKVFLCVWSSMFGGIPTIIIFSEFGIDSQNIHYPTILTGIICIIVSIICLINLPKRNKRGKILLGEILGFKKFLEVAERNRIEVLMAENRDYCYEMIPYAYVLGVEDKWLKNFENIIQSNPKWITGTSRINSRTFLNLTRMMSETTTAPISSGASHYSSGGGGGFSGGGGGGGGGGSW
ncbi:DUF2207 domain-containing protein [bacterium]|nr:DUF2207 domain-containing protein [bacterium]